MHKISAIIGCTRVIAGDLGNSRILGWEEFCVGCSKYFGIFSFGDFRLKEAQNALEEDLYWLDFNFYHFYYSESFKFVSIRMQ